VRLSPLLPAVMAALTLGATTAPAQSLPVKHFDAYMARGLREFEVPGAAVAVVKDGKVILAKGYGLRRLGDAAPVDAHTLFAIASNTKAFTTAALAILVEEGRLGWDEPVTRYLPDFQLYDPYVSREITVRDLVSHRSGLGLGGGDLLWLGTTYRKAEIVHRIRALKPASSFRSRYAYQNIMFLVAGQVIEAVSGRSWEDFIRERIFTPLGMTESNTSVRSLTPGTNFASPHARLQNVVRPVAFDTVDQIAAVGGINASVSDLARWMLVQLDSGRVSGRRLYSAASAREMWSPTTIVPIDDPAPGLEALRPNFSSYGLGWFLRDYRGRKIVTHTGGLAGMISRVLLVPGERLGIAVLTNQEESLINPVAYRILDAYLGAPPTDWIAAFRRETDRQRASAAEVERRLAGARHPQVGPSLPLGQYAGRYSDAMYGDATISLEGSGLVLRFLPAPHWIADLEHWQYDTFVAHWRDHYTPDAFVTFALNPDGSISQVKLAAVSPLADFSYDYQDLLFVPQPARAPEASR
jgi:CubicO group peptidase (beta-lactamase class C family)